jgi:hypothetical protein
MEGDGMLPLSIARARVSLAPEKRTPRSVGWEPATVKWNQTTLAAPGELEPPI